MGKPGASNSSSVGNLDKLLQPRHAGGPALAKDGTGSGVRSSGGSSNMTRYGLKMFEGWGSVCSRSQCTTTPAFKRASSTMASSRIHRTNVLVSLFVKGLDT